MKKQDRNEYDLSTLIETFKRHSIRFKGDSAPNKVDLDFNLPMALYSICREIEFIKGRLDRLFKDGV